MSLLQGVRDRGRTRKFRRNVLPECESPSPSWYLRGHSSDTDVHRVAVFPDGARIATACRDGHVRVFDVRGDGGPLVDIPAHASHMIGFAVLDDHVLASASWNDGKLYTWDAGTGEGMGTIYVGRSWVCALAAVGPETLVAGLESGAVVFIQHTRGRHLAEVARDERAHSKLIQDIAWHEDVMVTASADETSRVWSLSTRQPLAVLRGHRGWVWSAAVNSRYIATGSFDKTLRVHANGAGYPLVFVLDGLHTGWIETVQFIGSDVGSDIIMSGSRDRTMCFTAVWPDARPIARLRTESDMLDAAITADGHVAWVGKKGAASVCAPPSAVADAVKEHALATFGSASSAVVQHEPPPEAAAAPPLQGALVDVHAGKITAGEACRALLNAERCSASISEWWCGHKLLMVAVESGEVAADCGLEVGGVMMHNYWFKNLYLPTKRVKLGAQDQQKVDQCLEEAKKAGVIEGTQAILVAIEAELDLQEEVTALQDAGRQMLRALSIALLEEASARAELDRLGAELTRMDRVQKISLLMNAVFSVAPIGAGAVAGAGVAVFGMTSDLFAGIAACVVGLQGAATPPLVDKFVRHTGQVIASWEIVPVEARESIRAAAEGLGMTWDEFCDMIARANDVVPGTGGREVGAHGLDVVVVEEVKGGEEDGSNEASVLDGLDMGRTEADGEGGNAGEAGDDRRSGGEDRGYEMHRATVDDRDTSSGETREAKLVDSSSEVGNAVLPTNREPNMQELEALALNSDQIRLLNEKQAATLLAAAMVKFDDERSEHCVVIRRAIYRAFHRSYVDGEALIDALGVDEVLEMAMDELNVDEEYLAIRKAARSVLEYRLRSYLARISRRAPV